jgi:hypothetical protein
MAQIVNRSLELLLLALGRREVSPPGGGEKHSFTHSWTFASTP